MLQFFYVVCVYHHLHDLADLCPHDSSDTVFFTCNLSLKSLPTSYFCHIQGRCSYHLSTLTSVTDDTQISLVHVFCCCHFLFLYVHKSILSLFLSCSCDFHCIETVVKLLAFPCRLHPFCTSPGGDCSSSISLFIMNPVQCLFHYPGAFYTLHSLN